ncbi:hypothetical protein SNOG_14828 [Parastagonospora nodorum SN15]|uniref:Uncharacterized protein n=1 Tax=Phaeosphaeria nodorum (strain SN15 / ATCC MYA-4574 / FGSC 10173) TaxID=321614 RepID=Q0TZX1_PHANO|nr:hypothetical protein SNOG_14828 [Parastagonospora nodorum SN15]EAT77680.1 hypothetical protein SNOG_14828 [Parastagonospora nodorum SN15]
MTTPLPLTYRMSNGFGPATNDAVMAVLGRLRHYCSNEQQYLNAALPPIISNDGSSLLKLPDELLLRVARYIVHPRRNEDFQNIGLTCRQLRGIGCEALVRGGYIPLTGVRGYLLFLLNNPEYVQKVGGHLDLYARFSFKFKCVVGRHADDQNTSMFHDWMQDHKKYCASGHEILSQIFQKDDSGCWAIRPGKIGPLAHSASLNVLLRLVPSLSSLSVSTNFIPTASILQDILVRPSHQNNAPIFPSHETRLSRVHALDCESCDVTNIISQLEDLDITEPKENTVDYPLSFTNFPSLKRVHAPARLVLSRFEHSGPFGHSMEFTCKPVETFPPSIENVSLSISGGQDEIEALLPWLREIRDQPHALPRLRSVRLLINTTLWDFRCHLGIALRRARALAENLEPSVSPVIELYFRTISNQVPSRANFKKFQAFALKDIAFDSDSAWCQ